MDAKPNAPVSKPPREGIQIGDLLVLTVGEETAWCQCVCGRHVRYDFAELRKNRKCRECMISPMPEVYSEREEVLRVAVKQSYVDRLKRLCEREKLPLHEALVIAVERLLYAYGA